MNIGFEIIEVVNDFSHPGVHYILIEQVIIILQLLFLSYLMYIKLPELKIKLDSLEKTIRYLFYVGALYMVLEDVTIDPDQVHLISSAAITMLVVPAIYLLIPLYRYVKLMRRGDIVFPATLSANLENVCYIGMFSPIIVFFPHIWKYSCIWCPPNNNTTSLPKSGMESTKRNQNCDRSGFSKLFKRSLRVFSR